MITFRLKNFSLISRGLRFIKELRTIDPLPMTVEEYSIFLFHSPKMLSKAQKFSPRYSLKLDKHEELVNRVNKFYKTERAADLLIKVGMSYARSYHNFTKWPCRDFLPDYGRDKEYTEEINYSWDKINHIPKRYIFDSLGFGYCGVVFDYPFNKIEKINFNNFSEDEYKFYDYLRKNPISVFPKIYDLEKDQVIMEKLVTDSPKVKKFVELLNETRDLYCDETQHVDLNKFEKGADKNSEFYKFVKDCVNGLYKIFGRRTLGDFHGPNIAERPRTGEIVYFDPVGGRLI